PDGPDGVSELLRGAETRAEGPVVGRGDLQRAREARTGSRPAPRGAQGRGPYVSGSGWGGGLPAGRIATGAAAPAGGPRRAPRVRDVCEQDPRGAHGGGSARDHGAPVPPVVAGSRRGHSAG